MKRAKTKQRDLIDNKVLSLREQSNVDKEKLNTEPTELDKIIEGIKCDKTKTPGLCDFGIHNPNFDANKI